jgi:hypothetical protein
MPPQQPQRLLDLFDDRFDLRAHHESLILDWQGPGR